MSAYDQIINHLTTRSVAYTILRHPPAGNTIIASDFRGHSIEKAAKSILLRIKMHTRGRRYVLAVVPGDKRVNISRIGTIFDARGVGFASRDELLNLTGCEPGTVPPLCLNGAFHVITDVLLRRHTTMVFNAARLDTSLELRTLDYLAKLHGDEEAISAPEPGNVSL